VGCKRAISADEFFPLTSSVLSNFIDQQENPHYRLQGTTLPASRDKHPDASHRPSDCGPASNQRHNTDAHCNSKGAI
jgi:hypothetical protein